MIVKDIMTRNVVSVTSSTTILEVMKLMREENLGFIIIHDDNLLGVITDRDIVLALSLTYKFNDSISSIMKKHLITIDEYSSIDDASDTLGNMQIKRLIVTNSNNKLVGVLSIADLARHVLLEDNALEALTEISYDFNPKIDNVIHIDNFLL